MDLMNIQTFVDQIIVLLTPFMLQLEVATSGAIADAGVSQVKHLYEIIWERFKKEKEQDAGKSLVILKNFRDDPEEYQINLRNKLHSILQKDPQFLQKVEQILSSGPVQRILASDESIAINNKLHNSTGKGQQSIEVTGGSRAEDNTLNIE
jgi:hypothetical protein